MERELVIGGFYRHFKNKLYQVKGIAYHSETKEKMVVYQALYGDYSLYVRPFDMFMSEVDHVKYPDVKQIYRFEQVFLDGSQSHDNQGGGLKLQSHDNQGDSLKLQNQDNKADGPKQQNQDEQVDSRLIRFLDTDTYQEKLKYLETIKDNLDDKIIDAMAASLDTEVPQGKIYDRFVSLKKVISAHAKYECTRLRNN
ncbi:MAG: DUF1653 domain-containing protein [Clostridia bacterium]|nr:DUF1653 domain-containing protein [Clostridia bacterium]